MFVQVHMLFGLVFRCVILYVTQPGQWDLYQPTISG